MKIYIVYIILVAIQAIIFKILDKKSVNGYCNNKSMIYKSRYKKEFLILSCVELIILAGIRGYTVGADTGVYIGAFNYYQSLSHNTILTAKLIYPYDFEWGYFLLTKICAWFGFTKTMFLFLIAIISYVPIFIYIYRESNRPFLSILIYFSFGHFAYSLGIFRQMIAINIMIYAIKYILEKNLKKYLICIFFATSFHFTAIIMLPLYWISRIDLRKHMIKIFIFQGIFFVFGREFILFIVKVFPNYATYVSSVYDTVGGSYKNIILLYVILLGSLFVYKNRYHIKHKEKLILAQLICAIFLQMLGYHMGIFGRIVNYYSIFLLTIIPQVIERIFKYKSSIIIYGIFLIFLLIMFYVEFNNNIYITPYYFYWDS